MDGQDVCDLPLSAAQGHRLRPAGRLPLLVDGGPQTSASRSTSSDSDQALHAHPGRRGRGPGAGGGAGLPDQFDTVVGERGVQLSGGQKQRIALARALVREPKVLVLDDPLSAVDAKTEAAILDAIERQAQARTVVLVTHRVSAAARCERIVVLDEGQVIAQGTHDELVAAGGLYAAFAAEQSAKAEVEASRWKSARWWRERPAQADREGRARDAARLPRGGELGRAYDGQLLRRLWPFLRPHQRFLWAVAADPRHRGASAWCGRW
jgi:ATP-binding cassette subfamily B protein